MRWTFRRAPLAFALALWVHLLFAIPLYLMKILGFSKILGAVAILTGRSPKLKEWAYAGFAITLGSALVAHVSVGDDAAKWGWAAGTAVLWAVSYFLFRKLAPGASRAMVPSRPNEVQPA